MMSRTADADPSTGHNYQAHSRFQLASVIVIRIESDLKGTGMDNPSIIPVYFFSRKSSHKRAIKRYHYSEELRSNFNIFVYP